MRKRTRIVIVAVAALLAIPMMAIAADRFNDVPDTNIFHDDIAWLADAGVTAGCNPPANDEFCPEDAVKRQQMAAFMRRFAQYLGAEDGIVSEADNADTLDGWTSHRSRLRIWGGRRRLHRRLRRRRADQRHARRSGGRILVHRSGRLVHEDDCSRLVGGHPACSCQRSSSTEPNQTSVTMAWNSTTATPPTLTEMNASPTGLLLRQSVPVAVDPTPGRLRGRDRREVERVRRSTGEPISTLRRPVRSVLDRERRGSSTSTADQNRTDR